MKSIISILIGFLIYATPVFYPISIVSDKTVFLLYLNPITSLMEQFRYFFLDTGEFNISANFYSLVSAGIVFMAGTHFFKEKSPSAVSLL
jgi:ABC-type polysaccharide/polyol phosphate export permease